MIAKRRGMGSYMKRLKLASDSLKNTDPELGTVLNMDSILAFQGEDISIQILFKLLFKYYSN